MDPIVKEFLILMTSTLLSLMIIFFVMTFLLYNPIKENVAKRQKHIDDNISSAEQMNSNSLKTSKKIEQKYNEIREEQKIVLENSKNEANELKTHIINQANQKAKKIIVQAQEEIEKQKESQKSEIESEIISLSSQIAEKILAKEISEKDNQKMISEFLDQIK